MTLYFQKRSDEARLAYFAQADGIDVHRQVVGALNLYGIVVLDTPEISQDLVLSQRMKPFERRAGFDAITQYLDKTLYSSTQICPERTYCTIEVPRRKESESSQPLLVVVHSSLTGNDLDRLLQRTVVDTLSRAGIRPIRSRKKEIPDSYISPKESFSISESVGLYA